MRFVLLLVAAVIAVVAGVAALQWSGKGGSGEKTTTVERTVETSNVDTVDVLVARQPISMGTIIQENMIDKQPWPQHLVLEGFVVSGSKDSNLVGRVARTNFQAREPFVSGKLANPNDPSFLAAALPEGMRAVTLATDAISAVAGYIFPGDRVDVLVTHNVEADAKQIAGETGSTGGKPTTTEVLVSNALVLAVNVRDPGGKESNATPSSVTLQVGPFHVQKIRLAERSGTLALALRSIKDKNNREVPSPTDLTQLTNVEIYDSDAAQVKIIRGVGNDKGRRAARAPSTETMLHGDVAASAAGEPEPDLQVNE